MNNDRIDHRLEMIASRLCDGQRLNERSKSLYASELNGIAAAAAELIEAAELARDYIEAKGVHLTDGAGKCNLRAALARVQGAE